MYYLSMTNSLSTSTFTYFHYFGTWFCICYIQGHSDLTDVTRNVLGLFLFVTLVFPS